MKRILLIAALVFFAGINLLYAERPGSKPYPIPSFRTDISGTAVFLENSSPGNNTDGKRKLNIKVTSMSYFPNGFAAVWAYCPETQQKIGPFFPESGQILEIEVDGDQWGAIVKSQFEVQVDVWFGGEGQTIIPGE